MAAMINMIAIDDSLLSLWVEKPASLDESLDTLKYGFSTIKMMADANAVIKITGERSDLVISELKNGKLSYKIIADVFSQNENIVQQALKYLDGAENIKGYHSLVNVKSVIDLFTETGISPDDFTALFRNETKDKKYDHYNSLSKIAESTLEQDKVTDLKGTINKLRSLSLCSLYISDKLKDSRCKNDNAEVYKYLLIDTEISEEIKTTRIAEAIAGIQLYVNNCLNNIEKEVQNSVRTRSFFRNWEEYNRRYSTWTALSMLVYYPENYIDPVIRTGKTAMMDNLQQLISQEGIKKEAIDDAFRTYLTEFEQVADLNVISAYHDTLDINTGKTYFIGHSGGTDLNYYLRNVNNNGVIIVDKKITMPSSTWTDWKRIDCGINPYNDILRPILFNNRVYIFWLEYSELMTDDGKSNNKVKLCFSYLRYDDTWSETNTIDLSGKIKELERLGIRSNKKMFNYYCSEDFDGDGLLFIFYKMNAGGNYNDLLAFNILTDFSVKYDCYYESITDKAKVYFDRPGLKKVINRFENSNFKVISDPSKNKYKIDKDWLGVLAFSMSATNFLLSTDKNKVTCYFDFDLSVDKGLFRFSDEEKNSEYAEWLRICNNKQWYDCNVDYSVARIDPAIVMDDGNVANLVVFLYNVTDGVYSAFLYNSHLRKKVTLKLHDVRSVKVISFENGKNTTIEELNLEGYFAGIYKNYKKLIDSIKSKYTKVYVYIEKNDATGIRTNDIDTINEFLDRSPSLKEIKISVQCGDNPAKIYSEDEWCDDKSYQNSTVEYYSYKKKSVSIVLGAEEIRSFDKKSIKVSVQGSSEVGDVFVLTREFIININDNNDTPFNIEKNKQGAQYIKVNDPADSRIRLNTLFASKLVSLAEKGMEYIFSLSSQGVFEPDINSDVSKKVKMDFDGANALYFWELFYYAPMMIADILLQHQSYNEAERWLQYIFNPAGYIENGIYVNRYWNVRPLMEDTQWNESLPDDTDPDAIALADPMHYKMATFMKTLELLIARGDKAYRELEWDSLNEAKSWYIQALSLLGKEPVTLLNKNWFSPDLADAANKTVQSTMQRLLMQVNNPDHPSVISVNSANTLTNVFKPQLNEKLIACRETINQRLFNLRNGLSITGQHLYLPIFSSPADPRNMLESQVNNINSEKKLTNKKMLMYRFPAVIENAKSLVAQLIEFGDKLLGFNENRDNEKLSELLIHQGDDLFSQSIRIQSEEIKVLQAEKKSLLARKSEITNRYTHYSQLYLDGISDAEKLVIYLNMDSAVMFASAATIEGVGKYLDLAPNTFGLATGGMKWSAPTEATAKILEGAGLSVQLFSDMIEKSEEYRRRSQEWQLEAESAGEEEKQIAAELEAIDIQITAAKMQKRYITTEQRQNQQQLQFLQRKFTRAELYGWLRGRLMAIYSPFYDLAVSRCFMAEDAYRYEMNVNAADRSFINTLAWKGAYSGLMAGESLMLNLAQLEEAYLEKDKRVLEVTRTVSLAKLYSSMTNSSFGFDKVTELVNTGKANDKYGNKDNYITLISTTEQANRMELDAVIKLDQLGIYTDYPENLGKHRLIMQISVTLPALIEPYQNVRALLEYVAGDKEERLPEGCKSIAVSHGMNDSGLFHLQFGDSTYLPFEGLSVKGQGHFKLRFFDVGSGDQKRLLQTLTDIVLHIRYTIY